MTFDPRCSSCFLECTCFFDSQNLSDPMWLFLWEEGDFFFQGCVAFHQVHVGKKKKRKEKEVELNCTTRRALDLIKGKLFLVRLLEAGPGFPVGFVNHSLLDDPGVGKAEWSGDLSGGAGRPIYVARKHLGKFNASFKDHEQANEHNPTIL